MTEDLRGLAAQAAGLPDELADRLQGETAAELTADAHAFAQAIGASPTPSTAAPSSSGFDGGARLGAAPRRPHTVAEARALAKADPAGFNAMLERGELDLGGLAR
jgi:hypothetical protein